MHALARLSARALGALLALLVVAATLLAPSPAQAAVSGTLTTSRAEAMPGEQLTVDGKLPPNAARSVTLQRRLGTGAWGALGTKKSSSSGSFSFAVTAPTSVGTLVSYRVIAPQVRIGSTTYPATETPTRSLRVVQQAGTLTGPTAAQVGTPSTYAAAFTPARAGRAVKLERLVGSTWTAIGAAKPQDAGGAASFTFTPTATGSVQLRAYTLGWRGVAGRASNKLTVTVTSTDSTPPAVPNGLAAEPGDGQVELTWDDVTADDLAGYRVYYATDTAGPWTQFGTLGTGTSRTVTGLTNGTEYAFAVTAEDTTGNESDRSSPVQATPRASAAFETIAAGILHTCAVKDDGTAWCWGYNGLGQLGSGDPGMGQSSPVQVGTDTDWATLTAGHNHSCGVKDDGTAWCWGANGNGQLGDGSTTDSVSPVQVGTDTDWATLAAGGFHTCGVRENGTAWCWGSNGYGELGDGSSTDQSSPVQVGTGTDWTTLTAGYFHTCGVKDGTAWCWGSNEAGQLGDGTTTDRSSPVQVGTGTDWATLTAVYNHTCGVKGDGTAWCWGWNGLGQFGDGTTTDQSSPVQVGTDTDWATLTAGGGHTCGVKDDGTAWCWGYNGSGQLGDGSTTDRPSPVQVGTDTDWATLTAGDSHTCGVKADGTAWCWGNNDYGQLGDGTTTTSSSPVQVVPVP